MTPEEAYFMNSTVTNGFFEGCAICATPLVVAGAAVDGPAVVSAAYVDLTGVASAPVSQWLLTKGFDLLQGTNPSTTPNGTYNNYGFGLQVLWNEGYNLISNAGNIDPDFQPGFASASISSWTYATVNDWALQPIDFQTFTTVDYQWNAFSSPDDSADSWTFN